MKILDYLDTVRAKPESERRRILAIWTALGMIIIVGLWLGNMLFVLPKPEVVATSPAEATFMSKVRDHSERVLVGFGALKTLVENKAGLRQTE